MTDQPHDSTIYPTNYKKRIYQGATVIYKGQIAVIAKVEDDGTCQVLTRDGSVERVKRG